jgi:Protein of unknown function (DUF3108)
MSVYSRIMKLGALALVFLFLAFSSPAPERVKEALPLFPNDQCDMDNTAFRSGETMVFKVFYNWNFIWMSAGEVTFKVEDLGNSFHYSAHGRTFKGYDGFFRVRDKYDVTVDKTTLLPISATRDVQEGKYRLYDKLTFDRDNGKVISLRGKTKETAEETTYSADPCIHDILSMVYCARNISFDQMKPGQDFPIKIFIDKKTWPLKVNYKGKFADKKIRGLGHFKAVAFNPEVIKGYIFKEDNNLTVWVSDDKNRLPLMIETPISVGSVKIILQEYNGLRYKMTAKVKEKKEGEEISPEDEGEGNKKN